jgi:hypothetical protein
VPGPTLTLSEQLAIDAAIAAITEAQAAREQPVQVLADDGAAIVALGVPEAVVAAAGPAGFSFAVHEYRIGAASGWELSIRLLRDGKRWSFAHQDGPETHRAHGWREVADV